jgi:hypothetical protein
MGREYWMMEMEHYDVTDLIDEDDTLPIRDEEEWEEENEEEPVSILTVVE